MFVKPFELIAVLVNDFVGSAIGRFFLLVVVIKSGVAWLIGLTSKNVSPDDEAPLSLILCLPAGYSCASISGTMACGELRADVCEDEI